MGYDNTLRQLGLVLDHWERDVLTVRSVTVSDETGIPPEGSVSAEVTLALEMGPTDGERELVVGCSPAVTSNGTLGLTLETDLSVMDTDQFPMEVDPVEATLEADGTATVTVDVTVSDRNERCDDVSSHGEAGEATHVRESSAQGGTDSQTASTERGTTEAPPFRNPELLQEVYESHSTFAEMAEALDMDVTGETVRRYMIDYDIHQPNSYRSETTESTETSDSAGANDQIEVVALSDGIGLPENVNVEDLIETVNRSETIYEVKTDLDIERKEAHTMLKELNLIDLVMGRLESDANRNITREDVIDRLREVSKAQT